MTELKRAADGRIILELEEQAPYEEPPDVPCVLCGDPLPYWMVPKELGPEFALCEICDDVVPNIGRIHIGYWFVTNRILLSIAHKMVGHLEGKPSGNRVRRHREKHRQWLENQDNEQKHRQTMSQWHRETSSIVSTSAPSSSS